MFLCPKCQGKLEVYAMKKNNEPYTLGRYRRCTVCKTNYATIERFKVFDEELYPSQKRCRQEGYNKALRDITVIAQRKMKGADYYG